MWFMDVMQGTVVVMKWSGLLMRAEIASTEGGVRTISARYFVSSIVIRKD
jgi:hypothetical protein